MAKKQQGPKEPVVSSIPIPATDNSVVIDLQDGQKIVLGKLNSGAVVEVATWRGTGRPDSRTTRFMLGISDSSNATAPAKTDQTPAAKNGKFALPWKREKLTKSLEKAPSSNLLLRVIGSVKNSISKAYKRTQDLTPVESTTDLEINAWIENLSREVKQEAKPAAPKVSKAPAKKKAATTKRTASTASKRTRN